MTPQRNAGIERESDGGWDCVHVPVHGHRYGPLVIVPRRMEICAIQVCGVKPPGSLRDHSHVKHFFIKSMDGLIFVILEK